MHALSLLAGDDADVHDLADWLGLKKRFIMLFPDWLGANIFIFLLFPDWLGANIFIFLLFPDWLGANIFIFLLFPEWLKTKPTFKIFPHWLETMQTIKLFLDWLFNWQWELFKIFSGWLGTKSCFFLIGWEPHLCGGWTARRKGHVKEKSQQGICSRSSLIGWGQSHAFSSLGGISPVWWLDGPPEGSH
jgi:hypothetical protein